MIGPTMIETPQDIQSRPPGRAPAKSGPEDEGDRRAFDDLLAGAERPSAASDRASAPRESRDDRRAAGTEARTARSGESATDKKKQTGGGTAARAGAEATIGNAGGAAANQAIRFSAALSGMSGKTDATAPAAMPSGKAAQTPRSDWLSGPKGPGASPTAIPNGENGDQLRTAATQATAEQAEKSRARSQRLPSPTEQALTEKGRSPDGGAATAKADGQPPTPAPAPQGAMAALMDAGQAARRQTATRSDGTENGLMARIGGDGHLVGDSGRVTAREAAQPVHQVAVHIVRAAQSGQSVLRINLYPKELGQVDVTLEMRDGRLHVTVAADRPDTLHQLQQNARTLERALQDAGLNIGGSGIHFASRDGQSQSADQRTGAPDRFSISGPVGPDEGNVGARVTTRYVEGVLDISL